MNKTLEELISEGNQKEIRKLAHAYYNGTDGYPKDHEMAEKCFLSLIRMEEVPTSVRAKDSYALANIYYYDEPKDYNKAFFYYTMAAAGNIVKGACKVVRMFQFGEGTAKDNGVVMDMFGFLWAKEKEDHCPEAWLCRGDLAKEGLVEDDASACYKKAAEVFAKTEYADSWEKELFLQELAGRIA